MAPPTIVLLQGSFQRPDIYHAFARRLEARGFPVAQPPYPSLDQDDPAFTSKSLADDAAAVEATLRTLVEDQHKTVLLLMHSYGGLVGSEAVPESLTSTNRAARGLRGGVAHLCYLAAFVLPRGQSVAQTVGPSPHHDVWDGRFLMREPRASMYDDVPAEEAEYWAARVIPQSAAVMETPMERCAWGYVPSTYVVCTADKAVPPAVQDMFAGMAGAARKEVDAGHSAFLSKPEEVLALVEMAADGLSG
jgi:pimeloyl-ACP methyl ester carboxylesterase